MTKKKIEDYGVAQIKTLEGIEAIRLRPGMFIGAIDLAGVRHITLEIISNVIDEYLNGHCSLCKVTVASNGFITIEDNGRGVPFGKSEDGSEALVNIYTKLHTGAKFDLNGEAGYNTSGGQNGVGSKATNALSEKFIVISTRDNKIARAEFAKGQLVLYNEKEDIKQENSGTIVSFKPDKTIFKEGIRLDYTSLRNQLKELSYLSPGLRFEFTYEDKPMEVIESINGIKDYLHDLQDKKNVLTSMFYVDAFEGRIGVKLAMSYNDTYSDTYKIYTNSIPNSGGTHLTGFRTALTQCINSYARENKILKDKDDNFNGDELKEGLTLVLSFFINDPIFSGQTKDVLTSTEARTIVQRLVAKELNTWLVTNPRDARIIIDKALLARAAKEKAKRAKEAVREGKERSRRKVINPDKLKDAERLGEDSILLVVEGNSAAASMAVARDVNKYGILGLRGKPLNLLTNSQERIDKNEEIQLLISALGIVPGNYDNSRLRYGKLAIAVDSDSDGGHIGLLIVAALYKLCPEFIQEGRLCWLRSPLFIVKNGKKEEYYYSDKEINKEKNINGEIMRAKGLGALSAEQAKNSMFSEKYQRLDELNYTETAISNLIDLLGDNVNKRKEFIFKNIDFSEIRE